MNIFWCRAVATSPPGPTGKPPAYSAASLDLRNLPPDIAENTQFHLAELLLEPAQIYQSPPPSDRGTGQ